LNLLNNGELQDNCEGELSQKYDPVQSLAYDHGVSLIPLAISPNSVDFTIGHHELQVIKIYCSYNIFILYVHVQMFTFIHFYEIIPTPSLKCMVGKLKHSYYNNIILPACL
jgi:hypothetical protein